MTPLGSEHLQETQEVGNDLVVHPGGWSCVSAYCEALKYASSYVLAPNGFFIENIGLACLFFFHANRDIMPALPSWNAFDKKSGAHTR